VAVEEGQVQFVADWEGDKGLVKYMVLEIFKVRGKGAGGSKGGN